MAERTSSVIAGDSPTNPPSSDSNQNDAGFQEEFLRLSNIFLKPDYLSSLPVELLLEIIEELADDTASLAKLAATSRILQAIIEPVLYRRHVEAAIGGPSPAAPRALIHGAYNNLPRTVEKCVDATNVRFNIDLRYYSASSSIYGYPDGTGSALHFAAHGGGTAVVDLLLNLGANINAPGKLECDYPVADQLTLSNINRIDRDYGRISPLDPDPDSTRWLPLHFALCQGHTNTALLLMERGANYRTRAGNFRQPHDEPVCAVHLVAAKGHDTKTYEGTPLHHAVIGSIEHGVQHIEKLLNLGADVDAKDFNGPPPISLAVKNGLWDAAEVLLSHGANIVPPPDIALEWYHGRYAGWNHVLIDAIWSHEHMYHTPTDQWRGDYQLPNNDDEFRQWAQKRHAFISETVQTWDIDLNTVYAQTGHTPVTWAALNAKWKTETSELVWIL
ncbi:Ankyrin repeat-containing domain protein [Rhypophila decipiens]